MNCSDTTNDRIAAQTETDNGAVNGTAAAATEIGGIEIQLSSSRGEIQKTLERGKSARKMARQGPEARFAPNEESAVTRAIRQAATKTGVSIFFPFEGTTFDSCTEAKEFYNLYSWEKGFGIRYGRSSINKKDYKTRQDLVCSCEGRNKEPNSASIRTGCKAMIRLLRKKDHSWYVSKVDDTHNHLLSIGYAEKKQWNSHSSIDGTTKDFIKRLRDNNVSIGRVCSILQVFNCSTLAPMRKETIRSVCAKLSRENMRDDIGKTIQLLNDMKQKDPGMEVRFKVDTEGKVKSMIWATGKNRQDYSHFGDAITFDTTYRTNLYSLPFGLFVGVNCHFQSIIFAGVLVTEEKTEDFEWAFTNFVQMMGGNAPKTMLTDQCAAMARAIRTKLVKTRHRWCRWHVLKKAKERLAKTYSTYKTFKLDFHDLVTYEVSIDSFEARWELLVKKYKLTKNKYMLRLYKFRAKWARPYFMGVFCAGMTSTQRSESANHMLKQHIQRAAPMHQFVSKFNEFLSDRNDTEGHEQHVTKMVSRKLKVGVAIEEHAELVYTRAMYERFYDELFAAGKYVVKERRSSTKFIVDLNTKHKRSYIKPVTVEMKSDELIECECGLFEHMGMLCRHSLKVLMHLDIEEIPKRNVLKRWTKEAMSEASELDTHKMMDTNIDTARKKALLLRALKLVNMAEEIDYEQYKRSMEALGGPIQSVNSSTSKSEAGISISCDLLDNAPKACPDRTLKGGRPPNTGLKSWLAKTSKKKRCYETPRDSVIKEWPEEEQPKGKKLKSIRDIK